MFWYLILHEILHDKNYTIYLLIKFNDVIGQIKNLLSSKKNN